MLSIHKGRVRVPDFLDLPVEIRRQITDALNAVGLHPDSLGDEDGTLLIPQFVENGAGRTDLAPIFGRLLGYVHPRRVAGERNGNRQPHRLYPVRIEFGDLCRRACAFADAIEAKPEELASILLGHESYEVVLDETARTLDLLRSLPENAEYFQRRIGAVATFLPRNQPLYALACFGIVPALMSSEVHVKPPSSMRRLVRELAECLSVQHHFPNVTISWAERQEFVRERAKRGSGPIACQDAPVTDAVIFTGTMANADRLRRTFDSRTLFIANGGGHNPVVVAENADVQKAVAGVLRVQMYNSGQDCGSPNAVLVHRQCYEEFVAQLREAVRQVRVGGYEDRGNRVGPLSDRDALAEVLVALSDNAAFLDPAHPGVLRVRSATVEPTIFLKPLVAGGNYTDYFAPVFFVQVYERDGDLGLYFDHPCYAPNAMYVTLYGTSGYLEGLLGRTFPDGRPLHDPPSVIRDTDLHAPGVERGTQPYGGYGRGASCVSIDGKITAKPTLPQRDIYEQLVLPAIRAEGAVPAIVGGTP